MHTYVLINKQQKQKRLQSTADTTITCAISRPSSRTLFKCTASTSPIKKLKRKKNFPEEKLCEYVSEKKKMFIFGEQWASKEFYDILPLFLFMKTNGKRSVKSMRMCEALCTKQQEFVRRTTWRE